MNDALAKLSVTIGQGLAGNKTALGAFEKLGLDAARLAELKTDEAMRRVSVALSGVGNSFERAAIAQDIFGRGAKDLAEFFGVAPAALKEVEAALAKAGAKLDDIDVAKIGAMNDDLALQGQIVQNLGIKFSANFSPAVGVAVDAFSDLVSNLGGATKAGQGFGTIMVGAIKLVETAVYSLASVFETVRAVVGGVLYVIVSGVQNVVQSLAFVSEKLDLGFAASLRTASDTLDNVADSLGNVALKARENAITAGSYAIEAAVQIVDAASIFDEKAADFERRAAEAAARAQGGQGAPGAGGEGGLQLRGLSADPLKSERVTSEIAITRALLDVQTDYQDKRLALVEAAENSIVGLLFNSTQLQQQLEQAKYQNFGDLLQGFLGSALAGNSRLAKAAKGIALAQAIWNTATGVTKALSVFDYVGAAKIAAAGAIQIATIRRTNYSDSGSVAGNGQGAGLPSPSLGNNVPGLAQAPDQGRGVAQVVIQGDVFAGRETVDWLIEQLQEAVSSRDVVFINSNSRQALELAGT